MKLPSPEAQHLLDQLELMDKQFMFYAEECDKLEQEFNKNEEGKFSSEYDNVAEKIAYKFLELEARYEADKKTYVNILAKVKAHFKNKYNMDINFEL